MWRSGPQLRRHGFSSVFLCVFGSFVALCSINTPAHAELVYTAEGQTVYGQVRAGEAPGTIVVDSGDGAPTTLRRDEVSAIDFRPAPRRNTQHPTLNTPHTR